MRFVVSPEVFQLFPDACFGGVVATGISNGADDPRVSATLSQECEQVRSSAKGGDLLADHHLAVWRSAIQCAPTGAPAASNSSNMTVTLTPFGVASE